MTYSKKCDILRSLCICGIFALTVLNVWCYGRNMRERGYEEGREARVFLETERVLKIVREGRVYLAPLALTREKQEVHDCIFIGLDPTEPLLIMDANGGTVAGCYLASTIQSGVLLEQGDE